LGVTGYFNDRYETGYYWLGWFYIHKEWERNEYGQQLLDYVIKQLKKKKAKNYLLIPVQAGFTRKVVSRRKRS